MLRAPTEITANLRMDRGQQLRYGRRRAAVISNFEQIGIGLLAGDLPFGLGLGIPLQQR